MEDTMVNLSQLELFINHYLQSDRIEDASLNGLQVQGCDMVQRIVLGVSANLALFEKAVSLQAQAVLVHHGLFWEKSDLRLKGVLGRRVAYLIHHNLNLLAYHLPLDLHPEVGNNAGLIRLLPVESVQPFGEYHHIPIGFKGELNAPMALDEIRSMIENALQIKALKSYRFGSGQIKRIGVISGGAPEILNQAINLGLDLFITGEVAEYSQELCREAQIDYLALGHYNSEKMGVIQQGSGATRSKDRPCAWVQNSRAHEV